MLRIIAITAGVVLLYVVSLRAAEAGFVDVEFFEKKIRPVLVQHCYKCHSGETSEPKGGLRVDSREALRRGGESGPAVVPNRPAESLLLAALAHDDSLANMPPTGKLPDAVVADFRRWIEVGAPDPRDMPSGAKLDWQQVLEGRKSWWSWQPIRKPPMPEVRDPAWSTQPVDRFLQSAWETAKIDPAPKADLVALMRRVTFILTGLPPTAEEVEQFIVQSRANHSENDKSGNSTQAYADLVDRLLASPRFGERWARHWMDLARYGETHGSEHDPLVPHAWRYRDYLIRAFNADLPYDRFVQEQLAGDLLPPRWNRELGLNESLLGTMYFRMVEFYPTPVDPKNEEINLIESQIDSFGKTFQALTLSCARCHDHKFDAVSAADFYGLYGIFASTRTTMHRLDNPETLHAHDSELAARLPALRRAISDIWRSDLTRWPARVSAAVDRLQKLPAVEKLEKDATEIDRDALTLHQATRSGSSPLYPLAQLVAAQTSKPPKSLDQAAWQKLAAARRDAAREHSFRNQNRYQLYADFSTGQPGSWFMSDRGFQAARPGTMAVAPIGGNLLTAIYTGGLYTHLLSDKHGGTLRSPNFTLDMSAVSALVCGTNNARLRLVVENFQGDELLFRESTPKLNDGNLHWVTIPVKSQWRGRRAYLEIMPRDEMTYVGKVASAASLPVDGRSGAGIRYVVFHKDSRTPELEPTTLDDIWNGPPETERVLAALIQDVAQSIDAFSAGRADDRQAQLLDALLRAGFFSNSAPADHMATRELAAYRAIEAQVPVPRRAPGVVDEDGSDERLFTRGDYRHAGDLVHRRYLEVLQSRPYESRGSGRLQLAHELTNPANPLTSRVIVNRVWQHVFGTGLVRSVDNFGQLGETPSHPELLDWLAASFVEQGWSIKRLLRELLLSRAFQLSTQASPAARERDPDNRLWSHASIRRIEAEAIRDSLLTVSGRLNNTMYGLGIPLPVNDAIKDFDVPASGPLDGDGRRSIYLEARRNHPLGFLLAFDQPRPILSVGRRDVTNVPAQSLALLNDPFVWQQAEKFAASVLAESHASNRARIVRMYLRALGRSPTEGELRRSEAFVNEQAALYASESAGPGSELGPWRDLAHALFNLKEFIFLR
jgi:hypothetical protein